MKPKPTILELCCGWKSVSNAFATNHHWHTVTVDILPKFKPTLLTDVTRWDYRAYFETHPVPDVIWGSPPCRTFTVQAWGRYRDSEGGAVGVDGENGDACVRACLACIEHCLSLNPNLIYFVENPLHGAFRKLPCVRPYLDQGLYRTLQYGDYAPQTHSLKPTLVLTNCAGWLPKPRTLTRSVCPWNTLSRKRRTVVPHAVADEVAAVCDLALAKRTRE